MKPLLTRERFPNSRHSKSKVYRSASLCIVLMPSDFTGERSNEWSSSQYQTHAGFVPRLGAPLLKDLSPQKGERILDLGCGDGVLTLQLQSSGASVTAVDASEPMIHAARDNGITDAHVIDGHRLDEKMPEWEGAFDAVFSNAALHWMKSDPAKVVRNVRGLLKKGGRFVAEFGGHANIQCIVDALKEALAARGHSDFDSRHPWFFPTAEEYTALLEANGFEVRSCVLIDRPTPLPTDVAGWYG
ncbi:unnamed protein product [Vitrella brassicaformis CCMP3155]|uniref:Methyltransferase type 11 domain-containing protein n=1 Tax=Vitrella brassicaformis (strain CCMP3155) TaxID=1169540 RepID=A0A0G4EV29_VITBC|nr:unnamed protein product [Vitrella brassicaformis CCMP3155]|eukprot:CEM02109.1 unnamed protein product [Vitrella brassicaformis CCMP3155]